MDKKDKRESIPYLDDFINGTATIYGSTCNTSAENLISDWKNSLDDFKSSYHNDDSSATIINSSILTTWPETSDKFTKPKFTKPWNDSRTGSTVYPGRHVTINPNTTTFPNPYPHTWTDSVTTSTTTEATSIIIHDEDGNLKRLSIVEVSRYYAEALEYRKIKRFAKLFPMVKDLLNELLVAMNLSDPYDEDELNRIEEELKESKKKK